ncbi:MAG: filamentous hemagglutinin N-terminal domain-containing protein [Deltaproteobacteria bacterium]|nr:filamentous hemagglutinin N-terminal domain-containing protein [Deltaproteobacteria bacterium]
MKTDRRRKMWLPRMACKLISVTTLLFFSAGYVFAMPSGQQVVNGQAAFTTKGNSLTITNSPNAIINWQGFSINTNESVIFNQLNSLSAVLNRVVGQDPSRILGALQSNGRVFLINPNGILIGQGARIDVNGFFASTLNISNQDFLGGKYRFSAGEVAKPIQNQGSITTPTGGKVYLIAPEIENSGIITSPQGDVVLAAGHSVELVDSFDPNLSVVVSAPQDKVVNLGQIVAESGKVGIFGGLIVQKGVVNADRAVAGENGRIFFKATKETNLEAESITSAKGGGRIEMLADMKEGRVVVNGRLDASAPDGGNGGFIETSAAKVTIGDQVSVDTSASYGKTGTWLIDPTDFTIAATGGDISGATLGAQLGSANVTIATDSAGTGAGDLFVNDTVTWSTTNSLILRAHNNINVSRAISLLGGGKLTLRADLDANGSGTVQFLGGSTGGAVYISPGLGGSAEIFYNPASYTAPTDYSDYFTGTLPTAYMLVNNVNDLQNMNTNLAGFYALGTKIDASATSTWDNGGGFLPIGESIDLDFTGRLNGDGRTISGLFINRPGSDYVGLFGNSSGIVEKVGLEGGSITGSQYVGGLVGWNSGSIHNAYNTATVSGTSEVGGLVGTNAIGGFIASSYNAGALTMTGNYVGGLVGNNASGIENSYNIGAVTVTGSYVGGLVGANGSTGTINNSFSSGAVSGTANVGGLVGGTVGGTISGSFWDVYTSGQTASAGGTGLTTAQMMTQSTFSTAGVSNWDFTNVWWMSDTNTRPFLRSEYDTWIRNAHQLQLVLMDLAGNYTLAENISMAELKQAAGMWDTAKGFVPLGNDQLNTPTIFSGTFNGMGRTITGIYINRPTTRYVGTFGGTSGGATNAIMNLGLVDLDITGGDQTGGLVAHTGASILNCYTTGRVTGTYNVGGLAGLVAGSISNSYSTATVTGGTWVGGLVGTLYTGGSIFNSYSTGAVTGSSSIGGLVGYNFGSGPILFSFWNTQTSGLTTSDGGTGKTTAEMKSQATYTGWDFTNTWQISEGQTYPTLRYVTGLQPPVQQQTISGTLAAGSGKTIYFAVNGTLLPETATTDTAGYFSVALDLDTVPAGSALLVYVGGDVVPVKSAYVFLSAGGNISGLLLDSNYLTAGSGSGAISNSTLNTAKGGLTSADIPYTVFATNMALSLSSGVGFKTASGYTINGNITTVDADQTFNGPVTISGSPTLSSGLGNIHFGGAVGGGTGGTLFLDSQGTVTQAAPITAGGLGLLGAGGTFILTNPGNTVQTLAADTGWVQYTNSTGFGIGTVGNTSGITLTDDLAITAGGAISQTAPVVVGGAATFDAGTAGSVTLTDTGNDFASIAVKGGTVALRDANVVALHASTIGNNLSVLAGGDILLGGLINAGTGTVSLSTNGAIVNNVGGATSILANTLSMSAASGIGSSDPLMTAVHNLAATNSAVNNIEIDNTGVLTVNALVNNASTGNVALQNIGALTTDTATIRSYGTVSVIAHSPLTIGSGGVTASQDVTLEASPSGGTDNLTINGNVTSAMGNIMLSAGSSIVVGPEITISAPNGTITMVEGLNGSQTGSLAVTGNATATNSTVSSLMTAMAKITSEENGEDENELEKKSPEGGQQPTDGGGKTDETKNYCN